MFWRDITSHIWYGFSNVIKTYRRVRTKSLHLAKNCGKLSQAQRGSVLQISRPCVRSNYVEGQEEMDGDSCRKQLRIKP